MKVSVTKWGLVELICSADSTHVSLKKHSFVFVPGAIMIDNDECNSFVSTTDGADCDKARNVHQLFNNLKKNNSAVTIKMNHLEDVKHIMLIMARIHVNEMI